MTADHAPVTRRCRRTPPCFNEAAVDDRGSRGAGPQAPASNHRFNEAAVDDRGSPLALAYVTAADIEASMRPRSMTADHLAHAVTKIALTDGLQ